MLWALFRLGYRRAARVVIGSWMRLIDIDRLDLSRKPELLNQRRDCSLLVVRTFVWFRGVSCFIGFNHCDLRGSNPQWRHLFLVIFCLQSMVHYIRPSFIHRLDARPDPFLVLLNFLHPDFWQLLFLELLLYSQGLIVKSVFKQVVLETKLRPPLDRQHGRLSKRKRSEGGVHPSTLSVCLEIPSVEPRLLTASWFFETVQLFALHFLILIFNKSSI